MDKTKVFILPMVITIFFSCRNNSEFIHKKYNGVYFGQEYPDSIPQVFARKLLSNSINTAFSQKNDEFFFVKDIDSNNTGDILWMRRIHNKWTKPVPAPFNSTYTDNDICFSTDGQKVFFRSWRPIEGSSPDEYSSCIWTCRKINGKWADEKPVVFRNEYVQAGYPAAAGSGNLYFSQKNPNKNGFNDIYYLVADGESFSKKIKLNNDPHNEYNEGDMCVSADESFIITACWERPDTANRGKSDLYISFRLDKNHWSRLINLGSKINTPLMENCPALSPDGKYLFFNRYDGINSDDYWVSTDIISNLKKELTYFGEISPGKNPQMFAPGTISTGFHERCSWFSPDEKEFYYSLYGSPFPVILKTEFKQGMWSEPKITEFSKLSGAEFTLSPDGKRIYFLSYRPVSKNSTVLEKEPSTWVTQKQGKKWGEPVLLDEPLRDMGYVCESGNRNLYFFSYDETKFGKADILMAPFINGKYGKPVNLGPNINSEFYEVDPYIAPDESYLIFSSNRNPDGLYISFRNETGEWTPAQYLGDKINDNKGDGVICPSVSPGGKYIFFTCNPMLHYANNYINLSYSEKVQVLNSPGNGQNDIYWVSGQIIDELKNKIFD